MPTPLSLFSSPMDFAPQPFHFVGFAAGLLLSTALTGWGMRNAPPDPRPAPVQPAVQTLPPLPSPEPAPSFPSA
jgi:hypothetical protein